MSDKIVVDLDLFKIDDFSLFGICEFSEKDEVIESANRNWYVSVVNKVVESIFICLKDGYQGYTAFDGSYIKDGCEIGIGIGSTPEDIDMIFGEPIEFFEDEVSINRRYRLKEVFLEFDWGTQGELPYLRYMSIDKSL